MKSYTSAEELFSIDGGNLFLGTLPEMVRSVIRISGENNILFCGDKVKLVDSSIDFNGSNSVVFLCGSRYDCKLNLSIWNHSAFYLGENNYINGALHVVVSEGGNIVIGNEGVYSFGIWIRNADPHLIYDVHTKKRMNLTKPVMIGDHVWIGQSAVILKGSMIASGSIVGAMSVVAGKKIPSNTAWAGNPVRKLGGGIFWKGTSVHSWTRRQTEENRICEEEDYIYWFEPSCYIAFEEIDDKLTKESLAMEKYHLLQSLMEERSKNRFASRQDKQK